MLECPHCQTFGPVWDDVIDILSSQYSGAMVANMIQTYGGLGAVVPNVIVEAYPTLIATDPITGMQYVYDNSLAKTSTNIIDWLTQLKYLQAASLLA
jgi:hypothetical protein